MGGSNKIAYELLLERLQSWFACFWKQNSETALKAPTVVYAHLLPVSANLGAAVGGLLRESRSQISSPFDKVRESLCGLEPIRWALRRDWAPPGKWDSGWGRASREEASPWLRGIQGWGWGGQQGNGDPVAQSQGTEFNNQPEWVWKQIPSEPR